MIGTLEKRVEFLEQELLKMSKEKNVWYELCKRENIKQEENNNKINQLTMDKNNLENEKYQLDFKLAKTEQRLMILQVRVHEANTIAMQCALALVEGKPSDQIIHEWKKMDLNKDKVRDDILTEAEQKSADLRRLQAQWDNVR